MGSENGVNPHKDVKIPANADMIGNYHTHADYSVRLCASCPITRTGDPKLQPNSNSFSSQDKAVGAYMNTKILDLECIWEHRGADLDVLIQLLELIHHSSSNVSGGAEPGLSKIVCFGQPKLKRVLSRGRPFAHHDKWGPISRMGLFGAPLSMRASTARRSGSARPTRTSELGFEPVTSSASGQQPLDRDRERTCATRRPWRSRS